MTLPKPHPRSLVSFREQHRGLLEQLQEEVLRAWSHWTMYFQLYTDSGRVDLLTRLAPAFFGVVQSALFEQGLLRIARLVDPAKTGQHKNLSVPRLLELLSEPEHSEFVQAVQTRVVALNKKASRIKRWRDKKIAHADLNVALGITRLPPFGRELVNEMLRDLQDVMNTIEIYFFDSETAYDVIAHRGDGDTIVRLLERAEAHRECGYMYRRGGR